MASIGVKTTYAVGDVIEFYDTEAFSTSWNSQNASKIKVTVVGGGGGGAMGGNSGGGTGGGGGGMAQKTFSVTQNKSFDIRVGGGGKRAIVSNGAGTAGGTSCFDSLSFLRATGGDGGYGQDPVTSSAPITIAQGGQGYGGDVNGIGGTAGYPVNASTVVAPTDGVNGGAGAGGGGTGAGAHSSLYNGSNGNATYFTGGGGGGSADNSSNGSYATGGTGLYAGGNAQTTAASGKGQNGGGPVGGTGGSSSVRSTGGGGGGSFGGGGGAAGDSTNAGSVPNGPGNGGGGYVRIEVLSTNTPPTIPTWITSLTGKTFNALDSVFVDFSDSTDAEDSTISYQVDLYNGSQWVNVADKLIKSEVNITIPVLPSTVTNARVRVRAFDDKEYSSYQYSATFTINPVSPSLMIPNAILFEGEGTYVEVGNRLIRISDDFTVELFFKTDSSDKKRYLFSFMSAVPSNAILVSINANGTLAIEKDGSVTAIFDNSPVTTKAYNDGIIHHLALVRSGPTLSLYIDGVLENAITTITSGDFTSVDRFRLGTSAGKSAYFKGMLSPPRIWSDVRTIEELNAGKNTVYPDSEQGLIDYFIFERTTGRMIGQKNSSFMGTSYNDVKWTYRFSPMTGIELPYASSAQIKENVEYLRVRINEFRKSNGLPLINWTDGTIVRSMTPIKAVHINEMEDGVEEVYRLTGQELTNQAVKAMLSETVLPQNLRFLIRDMGGRLDSIVKALMNK